MPKHNFKNEINQLYRKLSGLFLILLISIFGVFYYINNPNQFAFLSSKEDVNYTNIVEEDDEDRIENGIHVSTGLIDADGLTTVINNCTACHSAKLIMQNRMDTAGWNTTIKWMQDTQGLWDLGKNQDIIVNYLVANYPIKKVGRRANLKNVDWYDLEK